MMTWEWWTRKLPLEDDRDVLARVGFRFIWATAPYFVICFIFGIGPFGSEARQLQRALAAFIFAVPIVGGALDFWRVHHRAPRRDGVG